MTGLILVVADGFRRILYSIRASRYALMMPGSVINRGLVIRRVHKLTYSELVAHEGELCCHSVLVLFFKASILDVPAAFGNTGRDIMAKVKLFELFGLRVMGPNPIMALTYDSHVSDCRSLY